MNKLSRFDDLLRSIKSPARINAGRARSRSLAHMPQPLRLNTEIDVKRKINRAHTTYTLLPRAPVCSNLCTFSARWYENQTHKFVQTETKWTNDNRTIIEITIKCVHVCGDGRTFTNIWCTWFHWATQKQQRKKILITHTEISRTLAYNSMQMNENRSPFFCCDRWLFANGVFFFSKWKTLLNHKIVNGNDFNIQ